MAALFAQLHRAPRLQLAGIVIPVPIVRRAMRYPTSSAGATQGQIRRNDACILGRYEVSIRAFSCQGGTGIDFSMRDTRIKSMRASN